MKPNPRWMRVLSVIGLLVLLVGLVDPLEGFPLILCGAIVATVVARLAASRWFRLLAWASGAAVLGAAAMVVVSAFGGIGGAEGLPAAWGFALLPYPAGALVALFGAVRLAVDLFRDGRNLEPAHA